MIYTFTANPSLDYIIDVDNFCEGQMNRSSCERIVAGGKGINVSLVLKNLGTDSVALGFVAGFTGKEIENQLVHRNVECGFVHCEKGNSRINVKIRSANETEINVRGPEISGDNINEIYKKLTVLKENDFLVLAGSVPSTVDKNLYLEIMKHLSERKINFIVDATNDLLVNSLSCRPFLIKPNNFELGEIFHAELNYRSEVIPYAKKLQGMGARNVLVSLAGEGAVLVCEDGKIYETSAPKIKVLNSVGAGDSMVAGFVSSYMKTEDYGTAFRFAVATGSASAASEGLATREEVEKLLESF